MTGTETRKVGERGQVTLPKRLREDLGISGGDEITIREEGNKIIIEKPVSREELAEGYRRRSEQHQRIAEEMADTSREANAYLGDSPEWEESSSMHVRRGDIAIVESNPTQESEQEGTRPCLVVQNDVGNENAPTTVVVPFTTSVSDDLYPFEVLVPSDECALREDSVAICSQIRTISIEPRITTVIGSVPDNRMEEVDAALEFSLGLRSVQ